jgi:hypothetical protein
MESLSSCGKVLNFPGGRVALFFPDSGLVVNSLVVRAPKSYEVDNACDVFKLMRPLVYVWLLVLLA